MTDYLTLLQEVKERIRKAQIKANLSVNAEMLFMYWDVGRIIAEQRDSEGWGTKVIQRLAQDIRNDLSEIKGFSERNLIRMLAFYNEYKDLPISPTALAQLQAEENNPISPTLLTQSNHNKIFEYILLLPWAHNVTLLSVKDVSIRLWYMVQTLEQGWSHDTLSKQIKNNTYMRQGKSTTNFSARLPSPQSALAEETLKDPYIFDFLTIEEPFRERELETSLVTHVEKFLLELGAGFAFVGKQYHVEISEQNFYIDLLFYHTKLHCYVVIELKKGKFKPEYAGKVNFYCSVVDDKLRTELDNPTIGLILCQHNDKVIAEYTLKDINKPIGISEYELTRILPDSLKSSLPTIEDIEERLEERS